MPTLQRRPNMSRLQPGEKQMVVLPELWSSGYDLERSQMHARVSQEKVLPALTKLARPTPLVYSWFCA